MPAAPARAFGLTLLLLPMAAWAWLSFGEPRPYYIAEDDAEQLTFYSARLVLAGAGSMLDLHVPGLTTAYAAAAGMALGGGVPDHPQSLLIWLRLLTALLTGLAFWLVARVTFRDVPIGVTALALAPVVAWPSLLLFYDYFDPIAAQTPLGLMTIALFWDSLPLEPFRRRYLLRMAACGGLLGLCLATKFTFVPLVVAVLATLALRTVRHGRRALAPIGVLGLSMGVTFVVLALPAIGEMPSALAGLFLDSAGDTGLWRPRRLLEAWSSLAGISGPVAAVMLGSTLLTGLILSWHRPADETMWIRGGFLLLMVCALTYTLAAADDRLARGLRHAQPTALCAPFLVLFCYQALGPRHTRLRSPAAQAVLVALALWVVVPAVLQRGEERRAFLAPRVVANPAAHAYLMSLKRPGTRVALWDRPGEEAFHFWGNYRYARDLFDEDLLLRYPDSAFFRLREVPRILRGEPGRGAPEDRIQGDRFGWPGRLHRRFFPAVDRRHSDEIVAGEFSGTRVSLVALQEETAAWELDRGDVPRTIDDLVAFIEARLGPAVLRREEFGGARWILIEVAGVPPGP